MIIAGAVLKAIGLVVALILVFGVIIGMVAGRGSKS